MKIEDAINWEYCKAATEELLGRLLPLTDEVLPSLDGENGIYVVAYEGGELGFGLWAGQGPKIVYVGVSKANSSRHFISGNTGTSTMRRSLAALLESKLDLIPVPRSKDEADGDRYNNYALLPESEDRLTDWMRENFRVAFLKFDPARAEELSKMMIDYNVPIFNFQNNPNNKYGAEIKLYRKKCAGEAKRNENLI